MGWVRVRGLGWWAGFGTVVGTWVWNEGTSGLGPGFGNSWVPKWGARFGAQKLGTGSGNRVWDQAENKVLETRGRDIGFMASVGEQALGPGVGAASILRAQVQRRLLWVRGLLAVRLRGGVLTSHKGGSTDEHLRVAGTVCEGHCM